MKIAVTYENGNVFQHFGHTGQFKVYTVENGKVIASEVIGADGVGHGALATLLSGRQIDVLICGGIGGGDIKLFALMGLYLGPLASLFALIFSCVVGLLFVFAAGYGKGKPFPFGPSIAAASAFMLFFGEPITDWYLSLLAM